MTERLEFLMGQMSQKLTSCKLKNAFVAALKQMEKSQREYYLDQANESDSERTGRDG